MRILAIDPGATESAFTLIHSQDCSIIEFGKVDNAELLMRLRELSPSTHTVIEMIASYGMAVGAEVFETCVWIGRYQQAVYGLADDVERVVRKVVKMHLCGSNAAKDSNISQALKDRFAPGVGNHGKGTKADPGWFYGFKADCWQAYALAVTIADRHQGRA